MSPLLLFKRRRPFTRTEFEHGQHYTQTTIRKYASTLDYLLDRPYAVTDPVNNALTPSGITMLWKAFIGAAGGNEFYSNANGYIFVGDSSATVATAPGQPWDLQGANIANAPFDTGYPVIPAVNSNIPGYSGGSPTAAAYTYCVWQATFGINSGNGFNWRELGIVNGSGIIQPPTPSAATSAPYGNTALPSTGTLFNRVVAPDLTNGWGNKVAGTIWQAVVVIGIS